MHFPRIICSVAVVSCLLCCVCTAPLGVGSSQGSALDAQSTLRTAAVQLPSNSTAISAAELGNNDTGKAYFGTNVTNSSDSNNATTYMIHVTYPSDDEDESVVSLVPLFVLLGSFLLLTVGCIVVCQRIRNGHKNRFHGPGYLPPAAMQAYTRVPSYHIPDSKKVSTVCDVNQCAPPKSIVAKPDSASIPAANGIFALAVDEPRRKHAHFEDDGAVNCSERVANGKLGGTVVAATPATKTFGADQEPTILVRGSRPVAGANGLASKPAHDKTSALPQRHVRVSPPPSANGDDRRHAATFHARDYKSLKVAFVDKHVTVHSADGKHFKVARIHSLPSSRSASALAAMGSRSEGGADLIRQLLGAAASSGNIRQQQSTNGEHMRRRMRSISSSPHSSLESSSPPETIATPQFSKANGDSLREQHTKPSEASAALLAGVKRRQGGSRAPRRRRHSAAPRLIDSSSSPCDAKISRVFEASYEPDDDEDYDESEAERRQRLGQLALLRKATFSSEDS